jgi:hypothetical protein
LSSHSSTVEIRRLHSLPNQFLMFLFCSSWIAIVSFRRVRGLMVSFPFLNCLIAHLATLAFRERRLVENCFAWARIPSRYFASTTLTHTRPHLHFHFLPPAQTDDHHTNKREGGLRGGRLPSSRQTTGGVVLFGRNSATSWPPAPNFDSFVREHRSWSRGVQPLIVHSSSE